MTLHEILKKLYEDEEALSAVIARHSWPDDVNLEVEFFYHPENTTMFQAFRMANDDVHYVIWHPKVADLMAEDWFIKEIERP